MPRRKQTNPQANVGRVEQRIEGESGALHDPDDYQIPEEDQLDLYEERRAMYIRRPQKRAKTASSSKSAADLPTVETLVADNPSYVFAHIEIGIGKGQHPKNVVPGVTVLTLSQDKQMRSPLLHVSADNIKGKGTAPSAAHVTALIRLLQSGTISLGPCLPEFYASMKTASDQDPSTGKIPLVLSVGLTEKALQDTAMVPEDERQRPWQLQLLDLFRWLTPLKNSSTAKKKPSILIGTSMPNNAPVVPEADDGNGEQQQQQEKQEEDEQPMSPPMSPGSKAQHAFQDGNFDASQLYKSIKPLGYEPELQGNFPELVPTLRKYQRRAAYWMISKERQNSNPRNKAEGAMEVEEESKDLSKAQQLREENDSLHPLWQAVPCAHLNSSTTASTSMSTTFYVNTVTGRLSTAKFLAPPPPKGAILADEMGLGKTVEILSLVLAHKYTGPPPILQPLSTTLNSDREFEERIDCVCGAYGPADADKQYDGLWLQCDECNAWLHGGCVGFPRRPPPTDTFTCPSCLRSSASQALTQPCGTTLIVCPLPILHQWYSEIMRHIQPGSLKVLVYQGQSQVGPGSCSGNGVVTAADLAAADIVLCSYDTLRRDVYHQPDVGTEQRTLRMRKKYEVIPTPLTRLKFWRVCLDESQMIESSTAKAAEMALKLQTEHRWCVTGTPVSRGLDDLFGLMAFLQAEPYNNRFWWKRCVSQPYEEGSASGRETLIKLLKPSAGGLLWRTSKADVSHELALPPQHHHTVSLSFSAIERHFYSRQHSECVGAARDTLPAGVLAAAVRAATTTREGEGGGEERGSEFEDRQLTHREIDKLLHPLLRLRQACVHPQVGAGGIRQLSHHKTPMTMGEVLEVLITKMKVEAEDAQRAFLAALNGMSGLHQLREEWREAVQLYRTVLQTVESNQVHIHADSLQRLHTLTNLHELLQGPAKALPDVPRTLRDDTLPEQAQQLRDEYLVEPLAHLAEADREFKESKAKLKKPVTALQSEAGEAAVGLMDGWWVDAVRMLITHSHDGGDDITSHIKDQLDEADKYREMSNKNAITMTSRFRDLHGLQVIMDQTLSELEGAYDKYIIELETLSNAMDNPSPALIHQAATCHRCRPPEVAIPGHVCRHCKLDDLLLAWEVRAFAFKASAREAGTHVSLESALERAQDWQLRRVGRGGYDEATGASGGAALGGERRDAAVTNMLIMRHPCQTEQALRIVYNTLKNLKVPRNVAGRKEVVVAAAKAQLEVMEGRRKLYLKARALSVAQRPKLYSLDELDQCVMKMRLREPGERYSDGDELYKISPPEIPVKMAELSADRAIAKTDMERSIGTLRYLQGLKQEQERKEQAAAMPSPVKSPAGALNPSAPSTSHAAAAAAGGSANANNIIDSTNLGQLVKSRIQAHQSQATLNENAAVASSAGGAGPSSMDQQDIGSLAAGADGGAPNNWLLPEPDVCPVCQDQLGAELVMLICGHRLCCPCSMLLVDRIPQNRPQEKKEVPCPTCRTKTPVNDLAYIIARDGPNAYQGQEKGEETIKVRGSYGTKVEGVVRRLLFITRTEPEDRVLVFSSWKDALELVSHALTTNGVRHIYPRNANQFDRAITEFQLGAERVGGGNAAIEELQNWPGSKQPFNQKQQSSAAVAKGKGSSSSRPSSRQSPQNKPADSKAVNGKHPSKPGTATAEDDMQTPRVLLLLVKQGANGLNLQQANHIVFLEPLLDPAETAQVVGRVDRMGQTKATHVHRFVIGETIEENVHTLGLERAAGMDLAAAAVVKRVGKGGGGGGGVLTLRDVAVLLQRSSSSSSGGGREMNGVEGGLDGREVEAMVIE